MKKFWLNESECTACGACANICPKNVITMVEDKYGFAYPSISLSCIDCDMCENVCHNRLKDSLNNSRRPTTLAAWTKNEETRFKSTSGGAFTEFASNILKNNGIVVGAQYDSNNEVEHVLIEKLIDLDKIRQSKYTQSKIGKIYKDIKRELVSGRIVGFCGAPCQVAGLYAYLGKEFDNLYTFDFICRGMNSPKAYRSWLDEIERKNGGKIKKVWFKYKEDGWKNSPTCTRIDFHDGKVLVQKKNDNLYMTGYLGPNLYIRPSCGDCKFKGIPRKGDITLADFWGLDKNFDDDKGVSLLLINNIKGQQLWNKVKDEMVFYERDFDEIFKGNICFHSSVNINKNSKKFLASLDAANFSESIKEYTKVSFIRKIGSVIKYKILGKSGK